MARCTGSRGIPPSAGCLDPHNKRTLHTHPARHSQHRRTPRCRCALMAPMVVLKPQSKPRQDEGRHVLPAGTSCRMSKSRGWRRGGWKLAEAGHQGAEPSGVSVQVEGGHGGGAAHGVRRVRVPVQQRVRLGGPPEHLRPAPPAPHLDHRTGALSHQSSRLCWSRSTLWGGVLDLPLVFTAFSVEVRGTEGCNLCDLYAIGVRFKLSPSILPAARQHEIPRHERHERPSGRTCRPAPNGENGTWAQTGARDAARPPRHCCPGERSGRRHLEDCRGGQGDRQREQAACGGGARAVTSQHPRHLSHIKGPSPAEHVTPLCRAMPNPGEAVRAGGGGRGGVHAAAGQTCMFRCGRKYSGGVVAARL